jgi:hypothetical protein
MLLLITDKLEILTAVVAVPCLIKVTVFVPLAKLVPAPVMVTGSFCPRLPFVGFIDIVCAKLPSVSSNIK